MQEKKENYSISSEKFILSTKCKCCKENKFRPSLLTAYNILRKEVQGKCWISSGYRCPAYNEKIGGKRYSYHLQGKALDVHFKPPPTAHIFNIAEKCGFQGCIRYEKQNFVHFDLRRAKYFAHKP